MVGREYIDAAVAQCGNDRGAVAWHLDRRITLYKITLGRIVLAAEVQKVHAGFRGDALAFYRPRREQREFVRGRDVQHVQARAMAPGEVDRQARRLDAGFARTDERVAFNRNRIAVA